MKLQLFGSLLIALSPAAIAQEKDARSVEEVTPTFVRLGNLGDEANRLLNSEVNSQRAWGAYLIGLHGLKSQIPALVRILEEQSTGDGWEDTLVRQAALDALIRLDAKVSSEVSRGVGLRGHANEAIILMANAPAENQSLLLETFVAKDGAGVADAYWLAAGNLLAETKASGFAAQLLSRLKYELHITVREREKVSDIGFGSGWGGNGCGGGYSKLPSEFPPIKFYTLTTSEKRGAMIVATGPHMVYYVATSERESGDSCDSMLEVADEIRVSYLASLLETTKEDLALDVRGIRLVVCKAERQCRRDIARVRREVELSHEKVVDKLREIGLLDGVSEAVLRPDITFTLTDERKQKLFPLPTTMRGVKILNEEKQEDAYESEPTEPPSAAAPEAQPRVR